MLYCNIIDTYINIYQSVLLLRLYICFGMFTYMGWFALYYITHVSTKQLYFVYFWKQNIGGTVRKLGWKQKYIDQWTIYQSNLLGSK